MYKRQVPLRDVLYRYVPKELIERPKKGFGVPLASWLREDLKEWAGDLLAPSMLRDQGFLQPQPIEMCWKQHQAGIDMRSTLWDILAFQLWLAEWNT